MFTLILQPAVSDFPFNIYCLDGKKNGQIKYEYRPHWDYKQNLQ